MTTCPKFPLRLTTASAIVLVSIALGGLVGCGGGSRTATVALPPLVGAGDTTGSKVMSWFAQVADSLYDVAKGVAAIAEGNIAAGVSEFAAGGLGIIGKALEGGGDASDTQAEQLTNISIQLDTLTVSVNALSTQMEGVTTAIANLGDAFQYLVALNAPINNAQTWLSTYSTSQFNDKKSREWARWYLAGCDPALVGSCPSTTNPVTAERMNAFSKAYIKNPTGPMTSVTDNFPLWWSNGVIGNNTINSANYLEGGFLANDLVAQLYQGITNYQGTPNNALLSYMRYLMTLSSNICATDITYPACDLNINAYQPLESYFSLLISLQTQLVMAQSEAYLTLAQVEAKTDSVSIQTTSNFLANKDLMAGFAQQLNEETEVFLQVAEQIALYRAADGRTDWSNFGGTDAGRLLARADFVVAQLAGQYYRTANTTPIWTTGYINPPWPSDGIVGRIFYAAGEQIQDKTGTRSVCAASGQPCSGSPLLQLAENVTSLRTMTVKPYLVWKPTADPKSGAVTLLTGTAQTLWHVQRLVPQPATATTTAPALSLPVGFDYQVASTHSSSLLAKFGFYSYDRNFVTPPLPDPRPVNPTGPDSPPDSPWLTSFGSFTAVEGAIGPYGLKFDTNTFVKGSSNMPSVVYADSYSVSKTTPGALYSVTYVPNDYYTRYANDTPKNWGGVGTKPGTWSASAVVQLVIPAGTASNVKFSWPSTLDVNLSSDNRTTSGLFSTEYYSSATFKQQILSGGKVLTDISGKGPSDVLTQCPVQPFVSCKLNLGQSVDVMVSSATAIAGNITFVANFSTEVEQYKTGSLNSKIMRTSIAPSVANWTIQTPIVTLK